ncbi:MAG: REP-associated tyrosine transposase [Terriglobales bacterium]
MAVPPRGDTGHGTYFITASTFQKQSLFQSEKMAYLFIEVLFHYRQQEKYLLHEFVLMPDHFHLLITPAITLERSLQFIKGGFSYRAKKKLGFGGEIWQTSFYDRRVRDVDEYQGFGKYIHSNPSKRGFREYAYTSASSEFELDAVPQRLNPISLIA